MGSEDIEIAVKKTVPKFLSILTIMNERAMKYGDIKPAQKEIKKHVPKDLLGMVYDFNSNIVEGISPEQENFDYEMTERFNRYLRSLGPDSFEVAEAVADPSLERVDAIVKDIKQVLERYQGVNPLPVLKNEMPLYVLFPGGNLSSDEKLDRRVADASHVLSREGKTLEDVANIPLEDIMRIRGEVQKRGKTLEPREFYEEKIAEKYAQFVIDLSKQITPQKIAAAGEFDNLSKILQENLPRDSSASKRKKASDKFEKEKLAEYFALQSKAILLSAAEQFISCAINDDYLNGVRELAEIGGVDVEMDGKNYHVSPLDYVALGRKDIGILKKLKDYFVDAAMEKGLDKAVTNERINEGIRFAYEGNKDSYINHQRFKNRVENAVAQSLMQQKRIPLNELISSPSYRQVAKIIDQNAELTAQKIFDN